jgi:guanylate kinase
LRLIQQYNYLVINDEVDKAVKKINNIIAAERLKPVRQQQELDFFLQGE